MADHKDAIKRNKQNAKRQLRNRHFRSKMRNQIKRIHHALEDGDIKRAEEQLPRAVSVIQSVAQKGIIHRKQAARRVSRLYKAIERSRNQEA